jgi:hypothetical protein
MPEIGATLREARMRARIDISELEAETKIRAKYLRALENEEWDLLPGPTYVKSFLRAYANSLGLDGRLLVEEYKLRHERPSDLELQPISPRSQSRRQQNRRRSGGGGRGWVVGGVVVILLGALYLIGSSGGEDGDDLTPPPTATQQADGEPEPERERKRPKPPQRAKLTLRATGLVYVCLRAGDRILIAAETLEEGELRGPYRAKRFAMTLGNSNLSMRVNGKPLTVEPSAEAIGYVVDTRGRRPLAEDARPTCGDA